MSRRILAFAICLPLSTAVAVAQVSSPHLSHSSAPFVGHVLTLTVEGAAPLSAIDLYFSPSAGFSPTPWGLLYLKRTEMEVVASGVTTATGTWSYDMSIPLDMSLAEMEAHFQALVDDPAAAEGRVFSDAVHARLLGPRMYGSYHGVNSPGRSGMYVMSAVSDSVVARVDYGSLPHAGGKPVFDATYSSGAAMSSAHELLFFDPFFGAVQARLAFAGDCSSQLFTDADRRTIFVLEGGAAGAAKIHAIDFATRAETAHLDLPNAVGDTWCLERMALGVFIGEFEASGRTAIRHVRLDPLADLGSVPVGTATSDSFTAMEYASNQVLVATFDPSLLGAFTRCWVTPSGITTDVTDLGPQRMYDLGPSPAADLMVVASMDTSFGPSGHVSLMPLSTIGPIPPLPNPPTGPYLFVNDIEVDGTLVWFIAEWEWQHSDLLYRLDLLTLSWTVTPVSWPFGPNDAEVVRDVWDHEVWIANKAYPSLGVPSQIRIEDQLTSTTRYISLEHSVQALHAVPVP